ncbi:MAG: asparaginase, partial [Vulcanimicrobiota bacterium]
MKKVLIIDNGGTVSMKKIEGTMKPVDGKEDIRISIFELKKSIQLFYTKVNQIDSTNLYPTLMKKVYNSVVSNYKEYDGFVVLSGTDTLAYMASFLSFWLKGIHKPVVLTGSQKPLNMLGSDAPGNIYYSILFACEQIPEVTVFFGKHLYRGNRVTKVDSQGFEAFDSPNYLSLGHVDALRHRIHGPLDSLLTSPEKEKSRYAWADCVHMVTLY